MSRRFAWAAALILATSAGLAAESPAQRSKKTSKIGKIGKTAAKKEATVTPRQENQFVTVDEFVRAKRPAGTAVSVEGYAVLGIKSTTGVKLAIVDSVDHVLNATDANKSAAVGASAVIPAPLIARRGALGMTPKGMGRFTMYTGRGQAQKELHDIVAKIRITGRASGRQITVANVEYADDNGDWKKL